MEGSTPQEPVPAPKEVAMSVKPGDPGYDPDANGSPKQEAPPEPPSPTESVLQMEPTERVFLTQMIALGKKLDRIGVTLIASELILAIIAGVVVVAYFRKGGSNGAS